MISAGSGMSSTVAIAAWSVRTSNGSKSAIPMACSCYDRCRPRLVSRRCFSGRPMCNGVETRRKRRFRSRFHYRFPLLHRCRPRIWLRPLVSRLPPPTRHYLQHRPRRLPLRHRRRHRRLIRFRTLRRRPYRRPLQHPNHPYPHYPSRSLPQRQRRRHPWRRHHRFFRPSSRLPPAMPLRSLRRPGSNRPQPELPWRSP